MTTLSIMMNNLNYEKTTTKTCKCGQEFESTGAEKMCEACRKRFYEHRPRQDKIIEHDPYVDLVRAIIEQAKKDAHTKTHWDEGLEPREFIQNGGVQLYLRSIGIGIRPSMNQAIQKLTR